jgi:WD40 repeat protein/uncharacterized protein YegL
MRKCFFFLLIILLWPFSLMAQSISLFNIDPSGFPAIKADFYAFDSLGNRIYPTVQDLQVLENGTPRKILNVNCPPPATFRPLSSVLVIDISGSMAAGVENVPNIELAKEAARTWVTSIPLNQSECAITSFDGLNYLNQDFTRNRASLLQAIEPLTPQGNTDYDAALYNPLAGGLQITKKARYKKVIVFLTDGSPTNPPQTNAIIAEAREQNCTIFCVAVGMKATPVLLELAKGTGGEVFDNITTLQEARTVYRKILSIAQSGNFCSVSWQGASTCSSAPNQVELRLQQASGFNEYKIPPGGLASIQIQPAFIAFGKRAAGVSYDTIVTILAKNADITIQDIKPKFGFSGAFTIENIQFPVQIPANGSKDFILRFAPQDSSTEYRSFEVEADLCPATFSATGGFPGRSKSPPSIRLVQPNGAEAFLLGGDTLIRWAGVAPSDSVRIEYSVNNGLGWQEIARKAGGLQYKWKKIPAPTSDKCLMRIRLLADPARQNVGNSVAIYQGHKGWVNNLAWSPDGTKLVSVSNDTTMHIWNVNTNTLIRSLRGHSSYVVSVAWSPDGNRLATGSYGEIKIWNAYTGALLNNIEGHDSWVEALAWSPDGKKLASGSQDSIIKIWDASNWTVISRIKDPNERIFRIDWSPDGTRLAAGKFDEARIWDINSGKTLFVLRGVPEWVSLMWSPDGKQIATGSQPDIKIWDANNGQIIRTLIGHKGQVWSVAWSPDGKYLASGSGDTSIRIWNAQNGNLIRAFGAHEQDVTGVRWHPDGGLLASCSKDNLVKIWPIDMVPVQEDTSDAVFSIVKPVAAGVDVDMQQSLVGIARDSVVLSAITNPGQWTCRVDSIYFRGADAAAFSLVSGIPPFSVEPGKGKNLEYRFIPRRNGVHQAQIVILTQAETIVKNIRGTGVSPVIKVINSVISFDSVEVGKSRDTLRVVAIQNTGNTSLEITATRHAGPNITDFSTISGGAPFIIPAGATARMDLRFTPSAEGRTSGRILFEFNAPGSPATIQLYGIGYQRGSGLEANPANAVLLCQGQKDDTILLRNNSQDTIQINSAQIQGANAAIFQIATSMPAKVLPENNLAIGYRINTGNNPGQYNASLILYTNSKKADSVYTIPLQAIQQKVSLQWQRDTVDLGSIIPAANKDTILLLRNTGTMLTPYRLLSANGSLELNSPDSLLNPADTALIRIRLKGSPVEGDYTAILTAQDTLCNTPKQVFLRWQVIAPGYISRLICDTVKTDSVKVYNNSAQNTLILRSAVFTGNNAADFQLLTAMPVQIAPLDSAQILYRIKTNGLPGIRLARIQFRTNRQGSDSLYTVELKALQEKVLPVFSKAIIDMGNRPLPSVSLDTSVILYNRGSIPFRYTVQSSGGIQISPSGSLLKVADSIKINIRIPSVAQNGSWQYSIIFTDSVCGIPQILTIRGRAGIDTSKCIVALNDIRGAAGQNATVLMRLEQKENMDKQDSPMRYSTEIKVNSTVFFVLDKQWICTGSDGIYCIYTHNGMRSITSDTLVQINGIITLGNTDYAPVQILSFRWLDSSMVNMVQVKDGSIAVQGICQDGGVRLFIPGGTEESLSSRPNPARSAVEIYYGLAGQEIISIDILDIMGNIALQPVKNQNAAPGAYQIPVDISGLPAGIYFIRLRTTNSELRSRLDIAP